MQHCIIVVDLLFTIHALSALTTDAGGSDSASLRLGGEGDVDDHGCPYCVRASATLSMVNWMGEWRRRWG